MGLKLDFRFRCLFPQMALLSNSCLSNCRCLHRDSGSIRGLEIRAQIAIKRGTELSIQYNTLVLGHRKRRELFRKGQSKLSILQLMLMSSAHFIYTTGFEYFATHAFIRPLRALSGLKIPVFWGVGIFHFLYL